MLTRTPKRNAIACGCMQASKSAAVLNPMALGFAGLGFLGYRKTRSVLA
jgi:hypothetical protein